MKGFLLFGLFLNFFVPVKGQDLEVVVKNVKDDRGILMVGIFNSEKTFTKQAWRGEKPPATKGSVRVIFQNIPPGDYAISVFHDADSDGKLATNFMGIPKEGFGFSNDVMGAFGPPTFEKAKFRYPAVHSVSVTLKYF